MLNIALIKDSICVDIVVFDTLQAAVEMLGHIYDAIIECPEYRGIGHRYINNVWYNPQPRKIDGVYTYTKDISVIAGDLVLDPNNKIYEALVNIDLQQFPPSELLDKYKEV